MSTAKKEASAEQEQISRSVIQKFKYADRLHRSSVDARINALGFNLHRHQHMALMYLAFRGGVGSQKEIADKFGISAAAVANTLKSLEEGGYILRRCDRADTRRNTVEVTEKGMQVIERSRSEFQTVDEAMLANLSQTEIAEFSATLEKMIRNLEEYNNRNETEAK